MFHLHVKEIILHFLYLAIIISYTSHYSGYFCSVPWLSVQLIGCHTIQFLVNIIVHNEAFCAILFIQTKTIAGERPNSAENLACVAQFFCFLPLTLKVLHISSDEMAAPKWIKRVVKQSAQALYHFLTIVPSSFLHSATTIVTALVCRCEQIKDPSPEKASLSCL